MLNSGECSDVILTQVSSLIIRACQNIAVSLTECQCVFDFLLLLSSSSAFTRSPHSHINTEIVRDHIWSSSNKLLLIKHPFLEFVIEILVIFKA